MLVLVLYLLILVVIIVLIMVVMLLCSCCAFMLLCNHYTLVYIYLQMVKVLFRRPATYTRVGLVIL